jgi:glycosyltransferase involved in cell wall biosynthesis
MNTNKYKILLCGPELNNGKASYGGGVGGYTRNMAVYLNYFKSNLFVVTPCFQTIREANKLGFLQLPVRLLVDINSFIAKLISEKPRAIHIMAQYRGAMPREFLITILASLFNKPVIYDIKAGQFMAFYGSANFLNKFMINYVLKRSAVILAEGEIYLSFINSITKTLKTYYFPNFVPSEEVPAFSKSKLTSKTLNILFVGYCYEGKGVYELIEGLNIAAASGQEIILTIIGDEDNEFKNWLNNLPLNINLKVHRLGKQPHEIVLQQMADNDVYVYPSKHLGEGHNNSINEAMMNNMVIVSSKAGFLEAILKGDAYLLDKVEANSISENILHIINNKHEALQKADSLKKRLINNFTSEIQIPMLESYYKLIISN